VGLKIKGLELEFRFVQNYGRKSLCYPFQCMMTANMEQRYISCCWSF